MKDTVGIKNPYRYRGYRYDTETSLYYLNSRYYNPEWGRFINADAIGGQVGDLLSHNVFAYCKNEPINFYDPNGFARARIMDDAGNKVLDWGESTSPAKSQMTYSQIKDLGYKKWKYRRDPANKYTRENEHVHLEGDGKKYQQDEFGNRRKGENSHGNPPQRAKEALKGKEGWDWDEVAKKKSKIETNNPKLVPILILPEAPSFGGSSCPIASASTGGGGGITVFLYQLR